jgi:dihydroflavonol-4-reductase
MTPPICVTGASGFFGSHIIRDLLAHGYTVRGTVRSARAPAQYEYLTSLPGAAERLQLVPADLLEPGSYDAAVAGCEAVIHAAGPYALDVKDPQRDLADPFVQGMDNVLRACQRAGGIRRVVIASSGAAITDSPVPGKTYTEADWNEASSLQRNPYYYAKTVSERAAWQFMESQPGFDLISLNPTVVIGPSLNPSLNTSNLVIQGILTGTYPVIMNITWAFVDVRDVATAFRLALETPHAAGRYICTAGTRSEREVVQILRGAGYQHKIPKISLESRFGDALMKLASYTRPRGTAAYLRANLGRVYRYDTAKIRGELGMTFMPVEQSILDTAADLIRWGHV